MVGIAGAHDVDERARSARRLQDVVGSQPAHVVLPVREQHDEGPPLFRWPLQGHVERVEQGGGALGLQAVERVVQAAAVRGDAALQGQLVGEGEKAPRVLCPQPVHEGVARGLQVAEGRAQHAAARVEEQESGDANPFGLDQTHRLPHAIVGDLEVFRPEAHDRLAPAGHERVHIDGVDSGPESRRGLGLASDGGRHQQPQERARWLHRRRGHRRASMVSSPRRDSRRWLWP